MTHQIRTVAVLGAGTMGSGIAEAVARGGCTVRLADVNAENLERGLDRVRGNLAKRVDKGKMSEAARDDVLARLEGSTDPAEAVADADLVIEAVFEDMEVKKEVFAGISGAAPEGCLFATNTSSLSVTEMAKVTDRPTRFAGMHFFFPANVNWLVEVVAGEDTDDDVIDTLLTFTRRIGKVPIETADAAGFAVNRFFVPWVNEAVRLLDEGVADVPTIDAAAKRAFRISMGPFELMNATGVPISLHAERSLHAAFGAFYEPAEGLVHQVEDVGEDWDLDGEPDEARFDAVARRLRGVAFGIACHLVDEGVCTPRDTDKGATLGLRWKRGPFALMNELGMEASLELVRGVHDDWGDDFPLPENLAELAELDERWDLPLVHGEKRGAVAIVRIDRPEAMNALNPEVLADLGSLLVDVDHDPDIRTVVVTGEGPKAFIAGADIRFMAEKDPVEARAYTRLGQDIVQTLAEMEKPVVAAINGVALGGGLELALACDLRLASDDAVLGLPEVTLGIQPGFGGSQRLPRLIGPQQAKRLIFTGDRIGAREARDLGLVLSVHAASEVEAAAVELAERIAANAPVAVGLAKTSIDRGLDADLRTGLAYEREAASLTFSTEDQKEGMRAFLERREPEFRGA